MHHRELKVRTYGAPIVDLKRHDATDVEHPYREIHIFGAPVSMFGSSAHTTVYPQFYDKELRTHQYQNNANNKNGLIIYMYKAVFIHNNDLKFNPTEHKKKPEENKDKQEAKIKDYGTIRKLVKGTDKPTKKNISQGYYINGRSYR